MKISLYIGVLVSILLMTGCYFKEANVRDERVRIVQVCDTPKYKIVLGKIEPGRGNVLAKAEFQNILNASLLESGCFNIQTKNDEEVYTLDVRYNFLIAQTKEDGSLISSKDSATLISQVQFNFLGKIKNIQQNATSTSRISENKYLGIGEDIQVMQYQKENVLKRSFNTIFANLNMSKD